MASSHTSCSLFVPFLLLVIGSVCCCSEALATGHHPVEPTCPSEPTAAVAASSHGEPRRCQPPAPHIPVAVFPYDVDPMQFALNLEFTEAEFFLHAAYGVGLDHVAPKLALGGPPPAGARKASLDDVTWRIAAEFGLQEVGHIRSVNREFVIVDFGFILLLLVCTTSHVHTYRAIQRTVGGIRRPLIDLSSHNFARLMDKAFGYCLDPPFDPYINSINFLLASYVIPYLGINGYVGTNPIIDGYETKKVTDRVPSDLNGQQYVQSNRSLML